MIDLNSENFNELINDECVLVDFYADWCGPCKMMHPVLEELISTRSNLKVVKVNVDKHESIAKEYDVMSIPTLILFKNGDLIDKKIGYNSIEILTEWIK